MSGHELTIVPSDAAPNDAAIDKGFAVQEALVARMDKKQFGRITDSEVEAALQHARTRIDLAKPAVSVGLGMLIAGGLLLRSLFGEDEEEIARAARTFTLILADVITEGPEQPCLPF